MIIAMLTIVTGLLPVSTVSFTKIALSLSTIIGMECGKSMSRSIDI